MRLLIILPVVPSVQQAKQILAAVPKKQRPDMGDLIEVIGAVRLQAYKIIEKVSKEMEVELSNFEYGSVLAHVPEDPTSSHVYVEGRRLENVQKFLAAVRKTVPVVAIRMDTRKGSDIVKGFL